MPVFVALRDGDIVGPITGYGEANVHMQDGGWANWELVLDVIHVDNDESTQQMWEHDLVRDIERKIHPAEKALASELKPQVHSKSGYWSSHGGAQISRVYFDELEPQRPGRFIEWEATDCYRAT